jgi:hypothetical protein
VGREVDGVTAQVRAPNVYWGIKFNSDKLALGLVTPDAVTRHHIGPGAGAGGIGIEDSPPTAHFVTFGGIPAATPAETMNRLQTTLNLKQPIEVQLYSLQIRNSR